MASADNLIEQVEKAELDIPTLLRLRAAVESRIEARRKVLARELDAVTGSGPVSRKYDVAPKPAGKRGRRGVGRPPTKSTGKHTGMSVVEAVRKAIEKNGGKASAADIKKVFAAAGDKRNLNFTIMVKTGAVKRIGFENKRDGKKGRAGGIYSAG